MRDEVSGAIMRCGPRGRLALALEGMFSEIDPIIEASARQHGLHWLREYRGEEVRSTEISLRAGRVAQLWVEQTQSAPNFVVCAWDKGAKHFREAVTAQSMSNAISRAISTAQSW